MNANGYFGVANTMKIATLAVITFLIGTLLSVNANEKPKPDEFEKKYGIIFKISDEDGKKLANPIEIKLHAIKIPEVLFLGANLSDVVEFLNNTATSYDKKKDDKTVYVILGNGAMDTNPPLITFAGNNVSILEVLKFITAVTDLKHEVENGVVILRSKKKLK